MTATSSEDRIAVHHPKRLFFDDVTSTFGNLGAPLEPNVFRRFDDVRDPNYWQFLLGKRVRNIVGTSVDYTDVDGTGTLHGAVTVTNRASLHMDTIRFEFYRRLNHQEAGGMAVAAYRSLSRRLLAGGGYATVDEHYGGLNADRFNRGQRFFATTTLAMTRDLSLACFFTHAFGNGFSVPIDTRFDTVLTYNVLNPLRRGGVLSRRPALQR